MTRSPISHRRLSIVVCGVVQGVGFRPFVHNAAQASGLAGWVQNEAGMVRIEVQGDPGKLDAFVTVLREAHPPQARVNTLDITPLPCQEVIDGEFLIPRARREVLPGRPFRPMWRRALPAWKKFALLASVVFAIHLRIARTVDRGGRSLEACPMIGRGPAWPDSPCAQSVKPSTTIRPIAVFMPNRSRVQNAGRGSNYWVPWDSGSHMRTMPFGTPPMRCGMAGSWQ